VISNIDQIKQGPVLLDVSLFITTLFKEDNSANVGVSRESFFLLERCKNLVVQGYVAPETATRLWKIFTMIGESEANGGQFSLTMKLPQKPAIRPEFPTARRMSSFAKSNFHILRITPRTVERAVELWEATGAGIEACVSLSAFREFARPPFVVVTANDHYDALASDEVNVVKPSDARKKPSEFKRRPPSALDSGDLMIT